MNPKLKMLCELYDKINGDVNVDALLKICFLKNIREVLHLLSHRQLVKFYYLCAEDIHIYNEYYRLVLVNDWLNNKGNFIKLWNTFHTLNSNDYYSICILSAIEEILKIKYDLLSSYRFDFYNYLDENKDRNNKFLSFLIKAIKEEA